ncbi:hypothetical protein ACFVZH_00675 [Streptomyces sp. NPDC059534]|uniref:hypothetical protein n=1 Tax=Streptomyces sp. NPDC059534 TaxID=3346859 RepID=UPI00369A7C8B
MRWTALVTKTLVAGAAGAFLAVSAASVQTPPASDADPGREVPAEHRTDTPDRGPGTDAWSSAPAPETTPPAEPPTSPTAPPAVGPPAVGSPSPSARPSGT